MQPSSPSHKIFCLLLCAASLFADAVFGQSLKLRKTSGSFWVDASAPAEIASTLQVSHDLRLWVDAQDVTSETVSVSVNSDKDGNRFYRLRPTADPASDIRIMLLGDSMVADGFGWGPGLYDFFKPNVTVLNYAQPAQAIKEFLQSEGNQAMSVIKPDYVLIQFGWVDELTNLFPNASHPEEFKANLRTIIQTVRGFEGVPFLVTIPVARYWFDQVLWPFDHPYNDLIRQIAAEQNVRLLELYQVSREVATKLGRDGSAFMNMSDRPDDVHHLTPLGAKYVCRMFLRIWPENFGPYIKGIYDPPPPHP